MAKFTFFKSLSNHGLLPVFYQTSSMTMTENTDKKIVYEDAQGDSIVYSGKGLLTNMTAAPGDPEITKVEFFNAGGDRLLTVSGGHFSPESFTFDDVFTDIVTLQAGRDKFVGSRKSDFMIYGQNAGNDILLGKGGNDTFLGSEGNNTFVGGSGKVDTLSFQVTFPTGKIAAEELTGVRVNLAKGFVDNPWGGKDKISGVEAFHGTLMSDTFIGTKAKEFFTGYAGDDRYTGGKGNDVFDFTSGDGNDTFTDFGNGKDRLFIFGYPEITDFEQFKSMMVQDGGDVFVDLGDGDSFTFLHTKIGQLKESAFEIFDF